MKHETWAKNMKQALAFHREGKTEKALALLDRIVDKSRVLARKAISPWHEQQALGVKSIVFKESGRPREAAEVELEVTALNRLQLEYYGQSISHSLALAASMKFEAGLNRQAAKLAKESIQWAKQFKVSDSIITDVKAKLRSYKRKRANSQRKKKNR
jgi:hypothetical protein